MTKFAAYDGQAIWGVGATEDDAVADARQWQENGDHKTLDVAPMSAALAARVDEAGGNCGHTLLGGTLVTWEEAEAA